ncbi:type II toxin-antitoxin system YafO family toxin [Morganella morganii]|uniref:type II toxin-antitoxin system YafO family toxin n=1 Tax=Morganella morganii TaxID=582 RepID=UPI000F841332|nr:type II toxin-antitoxin system YafO family toxin [Morganella morganii]RTY17554.1 hypothetical protein EKS23_18010 [Morganella morganii subsp. morganii]
MCLKIERSQHAVSAISAAVEKYGISEAIAESFIADFEEYKRISIDYDDVPNPSVSAQFYHPAHIDTIGRDKLMDWPDEARAEDVHHVHLWQTGCVWEDEDEGLNVQWDCTSDSFIIYSYFKDKDSDHHFYIIDFLFDQAHTIIEDSEQILKWVELARQHREANT